MVAVRWEWFLVAALAVLGPGCGRWVDDLACFDEGCRFTRGEWARVQSLSQLGDPPGDSSNGLLAGVLARPDPMQDPIVRLGWWLYYDTDLSGAPTWKDMLGRPTSTSRASVLKPDDRIKVACATCHDPEQGGGDVTSVPRHVSVGAGWYDVNGQQTLNVAHYRYLYWNGRADSLWSQAAQVMESGVSVNGDRLSIVATVRAKYSQDFGDLLRQWDLPAPTDPARCTLDDCTAPECNLVTAGSGATATRVCRPAIPAHGKRGSKVGCQYGSPDEPFKDDFDCMRPDDQRRVTRAYVAIAKAIASYEWFLTSTDSPFDRYAEEGPASAALSPEAQRGLKLFVGRAGCIDCHRTPLLSDGEFHNIGVPQAGAGVPTVADCLRAETLGACDCRTGRKCLPWGACEGLQRFADRPRVSPSDAPPDAGSGILADGGPGPGAESCLLAPPGPDPQDGDGARLSSFEFSRVSPYSDDAQALPPPALAVVKGAWRTPSLRDVALTAPYMHDGVFASLADVVWHYDQGAAANDIGPVAAEIQPLRLTARERADLVAFLQNLTGHPRRDRDLARPPDSCPLYTAPPDGGTCGTGTGQIPFDAGPGPDSGAAGP
jgi:cytochrome c peroxidase